MLNPFSFQGPEFLVFYAVLGAVVLWGLVRAQTRQEAAGLPGMSLSDPYLIACLRGGEKEANRVAVLALVDRGLLTAEDRWVEAVDAEAVHKVQHPLERAILTFFATSGLAEAATSDPDVREAVEKLEEELVGHGLLPSPIQGRARLRRLALAMGLLWSVALIKFFVATSRGHYNVGFLAVSAVVLTGVAGFLSGRRRTAAGNGVVADLRELFQGLRSRGHDLKPGESGNEPALLAAVYGLPALSGLEWAFADKLFPLARRKPDSGACGGGCGSCATSSDSSGSSSCGGGSGGGDGCGGGGGGGCGGGCGGCGGCGS